MTDSRPDGRQFFADFAYGLSSSGGIEGLAHPLRDGHVARVRYSLDLPVFGILHNDL